jgi:hypothetical protein
MSKKRLTGGGTDISFYEPEPGDRCEYRHQQKVGGKWCNEACGDPAVTILGLGRHEPTAFGGKYLAADQMRLCKAHLRRVITECVGMLEVL